MAKIRVTSNCLTLAWMASLLSLAVAALDMPNAAGAQVGVCRPGTPYPCAADGTCRPKRETFGSYHTRWRPWPGDPQQAVSTLDDDQTPDDKQELKGFERPTPEKEGNRAPAKTNAFQSSETEPETDASEAATEEQEPATDLPAEDLFPDFDDQSSYQLLPPQDDAPPALPPSLRKFATSHQLARVALPQLSQTNPVRQSFAIAPNPARQATAKKPLQQPLRYPALRYPAPRYPEPSSAITQVAAEQRISSRTHRPANMNLVNPAATGTQQGAQQAIYYEATDKP